MTSEEIIDEWIDAHDELTRDGSTVKHEGQRLGSFRDHRCSFGPDDGGVKGEIVEFDEDTDALIVDGSQACYVGENATDTYREMTSANILYDGMVEFTGKFAVWPMSGRRPEIDGPLPEDD